MALTREQMDAYATLARDGFAFFVNEHGPVSGRIIKTTRYPQWITAVTAFQAFVDDGTPASISLTKAANYDAVQPRESTRR